MALTYSKQLYLQLCKYGKRNLFAALGNNFQSFPSVAHYSDDIKPSTKKLSNAMKAYLDRAVKFDKFMKDQLEEYELGKKFLAGMMGKKSDEMTQKDVDEAIEYLFPSALYVPKARPLMKPPAEIFGKQKEAVFDYTGRPYHYLFYTNKPNYSQCLHEAASFLESLNLKQLRNETPEPLAVVQGRWCNKEELEGIFLEKLFDIEYEKFVEVFEKLIKHPFAMSAEKFIKKYKVTTMTTTELKVPDIVQEDNVKVVHAKGMRRKQSIADVTIRYPGKGEIRVNNLNIEYFPTVQQREQVIFPLILTDMLGKVDIKATVEGGGHSGQAGAVRSGIAIALQALVPKNVIFKMKVAGLLQKDFRKLERQKPGKRGARRGYTWLKR